MKSFLSYYLKFYCSQKYFSLRNCKRSFKMLSWINFYNTSLSAQVPIKILFREIWGSMASNNDLVKNQSLKAGAIHSFYVWVQILRRTRLCHLCSLNSKRCTYGCSRNRYVWIQRWRAVILQCYNICITKILPYLPLENIDKNIRKQ